MKPSHLRVSFDFLEADYLYNGIFDQMYLLK